MHAKIRTMLMLIFYRFVIDFFADFDRVWEVMLAAKMHDKMMSNVDEFLIIF